MIRRKVVIALIYLRSNATRQVGKQRERNESERASRGREKGRERERERKRHPRWDIADSCLTCTKR